MVWKRSESTATAPMSPNDVIRTGILYKKGQGARWFGRRNWKPRFFQLTATKLVYFTFEGGAQRGELDLTKCKKEDLQVMPADCTKTGKSSSTIWRVAIQVPGRRFIFAANSEYEMNLWVHDLLSVFHSNSHPGVPVRPSLIKEQLASVYKPPSTSVSHLPRQSFNGYRLRGVRKEPRGSDFALDVY
ncbi:hypothetical protein SPRG_06280 [Saprolegnia parasitica CBS 223.65]|uniref:PH domain-containing protein n=1 Tax=Saprolegnia parasitica (strain CBS 223.65) TaxID=695850 RepID=A0A067CNZ2_SAPPC|nr:hypothetical protein SPRG_06280 [Saprolegnia parasitica CBS 223.65]KDO28231.1 hypothetical protein SPRG_06280 [Saprolegnia parasitica CBS 223.65]|eukprot:XP_012201056.1 hypothetical protein SPRG_06280 [Saprolegnia parasitica CBS 223.65]